MRNSQIYLVSIIVTLTVGMCCGCNRQNKAKDHFELIIGSQGHTSGKFNRPRGIIHNKTLDLLHVVDWDGRIQTFTMDGKFRGSWIMPEVKKGKPEDLCLTKDQTILVTDTHYSRIVEFNLKGEEIRRFGSYGNGEGQFIYPVGICLDKDENIYVSEYGDNNRVQKFSRTGEFITEFGTFGREPGQFERPSGISFGPDGNLYVTDGVNHRIQVFTADGKFLRVIGKQGKALGEFSYPYDIDFRGDQMLVLEFGNQRVQRLTMKGEGVAVFGKPGRSDGEFASPWRFCAAGSAIYVSDTNNCRVVKLANF